jgi:hypothetical protein
MCCFRVLVAQTLNLGASQKQIAQVFDVTPQNITIHLKQIFTNGELEEKSTCKESLHMFYNFSYHILIFFAFFI